MYFEFDASKFISNAHKRGAAKNKGEENKENSEMIHLDENAIGKQRENYNATMQWLRNKWSCNEDSSVGRIICPLFSLQTSVHQAIIADNVEYIKDQIQNIKIKKLNTNEYLAIACLCGSKQVAEFLMQDLKKDYLSKEYEYILGYVAASPNTAWALEIAQKLAEAGRSMPVDVFGLADFNIVNKLQEKFKSINPNEIKSGEFLDDTEAPRNGDGKGSPSNGRKGR